ncbi:YggS family pyridoxal phosphate-dependent enzyme [Pseudoxanthomonas daejeonensis]|uniref:YggS family pyridoxal phosphate-dependent enzyme n=1 Tax=Pseudoxanthomonas daejeonensis TaxID=266062 RepID=UPI001F545CA8|nr:YggS family pyridoxal phosphate-dependent enzyme [Pseudoxanthomonas daejeonensis]UNK57801.1 YggS family pyridoxal phosphate-dependent enzyme [Pseudoxanthomonas daejeonensis]
MSNDRLRDVTQRILNAADAAGRPPPRLLAVSKTQPADAVAALATAGQRAFGENYVQEAAAKREALAGTHPGLEWHLIGHLQSNKAALAAEVFDWVQSIDRPSLVDALARHRPTTRGPLNVLVQVNAEGETGKAGCRPEDLPALARRIAAEPRLLLRGLMSIPVPHADPEQRRPAFQHMRQLFEALAADHAHVDTLSMGMSDDFPIAIAEGATLVRIGTALFGARTR